MLPTRIFALTVVAMLAFAGNSLLCRMALKQSSIDAASLTSIRLIAGAAMLWAIMCMRGTKVQGTKLRGEKFSAKGNWLSASALFVYAACFSYAYVSLSAATGALLLFGAVQFTMIGYGLYAGERFGGWQVIGLIAALSGLAGLLLPGLAAPSPLGAGLMLCAGVAWGVYSLRGRKSGDATVVTAGNFLRAVPMALALSLSVRLLMPHSATIDFPGATYAIASGALASGVGYAIWYTALRGLKATTAATVQLSVPVIAGAGGVVFLNEVITVRLLIASAAILGGIALVIFDSRTNKR